MATSNVPNCDLPSQPFLPYFIPPIALLIMKNFKLKRRGEWSRHGEKFIPINTKLDLKFISQKKLQDMSNTLALIALNKEKPKMTPRILQNKVPKNSNTLLLFSILNVALINFIFF